MIKLSKRATIYLDPKIHKILKVKAVETSRSISEIVNEAILHELAEDREDFQAFVKRASEPTISYEVLLKELRKGTRKKVYEGMKQLIELRDNIHIFDPYSSQVAVNLDKRLFSIQRTRGKTKILFIVNTSPEEVKVKTRFNKDIVRRKKFDGAIEPYGIYLLSRVNRRH